jgi:hypothetical protein
MSATEALTTSADETGREIAGIGEGLAAGAIAGFAGGLSPQAAQMSNKPGKIVFGIFITIVSSF